MNRRLFLRTSVAGLVSISGLPWQSWEEDKSDSASQASALLKPLWPAGAPHLFRDALVDGVGFSFTYDGKRVGPAPSGDWRVSSGAAGRTEFRHGSGLIAVREVRAYPAFEAVEYTVRFRNESSALLPALSEIQALDLVLSEAVLPGVSVVSSGGGGGDSEYPPRDFAILRHSLAPLVPAYGQLTLTTVGGRSSNLNLPFFFIDNADRNNGLFVAFGWSGQWRINITGEFPKQVLHITGEIPDLNFRLRPGEEVSGPRILLGCYRGPLSAGSNRLRRLIREQFTPLFEGRKPEPLPKYDHWWNIGDSFDEHSLRRLADSAAALGQRVFLLDAGWSVNTPGHKGFDAGAGNWAVNHDKFPSGLRPFADYVRSKGMKFGLWFEPERVAQNSILARDHPDWVIWLPGNDNGLLNYGIPEAEHWVRDLLDRYIREADVEYLRYDFNIDPLEYWAANDPSDRRGVSQILHVEAFYRVIDWLRTDHPRTELEGCASGGRRIDLETARRFHSFWISDYTVDPNIIRFHLNGLNYFLPGNYLYTCYTLPLPGQKNFSSPDLAFQSLFGGEFGTGGRIDEWPQHMTEQARRHFAVYDKLRRYLVEEYYPLTPQPRDLRSWEAWQFHDPKTNSGFVQAFRIESPDQTRGFGLERLSPGSMYRLTDPYSGAQRTVTGEALSRGLEFTLAPMSSQILLYLRLSSRTSIAAPLTLRQLI